MKTEELILSVLNKMFYNEIAKVEYYNFVDDQLYVDFVYVDGTRMDKRIDIIEYITKVFNLLNDKQP